QITGLAFAVLLFNAFGEDPRVALFHGALGGTVQFYGQVLGHGAKVGGAPMSYVLCALSDAPWVADDPWPKSGASWPMLWPWSPLPPPHLVHGLALGAL